MKIIIFTSIILIFIILLASLTIFLTIPKNNTAPINNQSPSNSANAITNIVPEKLPTATPVASPKEILVPPITSFSSRVTKKPFGIKVSPTDSPVSPEKFSGYHTGVDFETTAEEQDIDVPIYTMCDGQLIYRNYVSGYGGVAIQSCQINGTDVTVLYGHLKLSSINLKTNTPLKAGDKIGILGKGYSTETSGERKHLHLGIHQGKNIDFRGYVQKSADLSAWIDVMSILR